MDSTEGKVERVRHTPGPWKHYADLPSTDPNWHIITTENGLRVLANVHIEPGNGMDEANACLVSAAPDLLKALKALEQAANNMADATNCGMCDEEISEARAAISKAEGRT